MCFNAQALPLQPLAAAKETKEMESPCPVAEKLSPVKSGPITYL